MTDPAVRRWLEHRAEICHRRAGTWTMHRLDAGTLSAEAMIPGIVTLLEALADDLTWLTTDNPEAWRQVMVDQLRCHLAQFLELTEGA